LYQYYNPVIITYPWEKQQRQEQDKQKIVVIAGSYNPPHQGHLVMIEYLASRYKKVLVAVGMNPNKRYAVSPATRAGILERMVQTLGATGSSNVKVEVVSDLIWRYSMSQNAQIMFRGIRSWEKDGPEERFLHKQNLFWPLVLGPFKWPLPTYFIEGKPEYCFISSTLIRNLCTEGNNSIKDETGRTFTLSDLVPKEVERDVAIAYGSSE